MPRMSCPEHGVIMIRVPWSESGSHCTALFKAYFIDWLKDSTSSVVARHVRPSWTAVPNIQDRAVKSSLERRKQVPSKHIGLDQTSFRKRQNYVTMVADISSGIVMHVAEDWRKDSFKGWLESLEEAELSAIESISLDTCLRISMPRLRLCRDLTG